MHDCTRQVCAELNKLKNKLKKKQLCLPRPYLFQDVIGSHTYNFFYRKNRGLVSQKVLHDKKNISLLKCRKRGA